MAKCLRCSRQNTHPCLTTGNKSCSLLWRRRVLFMCCCYNRYNWFAICGQFKNVIFTFRRGVRQLGHLLTRSTFPLKKPKQMYCLRLTFEFFLLHMLTSPVLDLWFMLYLSTPKAQHFHWGTFSRTGSPSSNGHSENRGHSDWCMQPSNFGKGLHSLKSYVLPLLAKGRWSSVSHGIISFVMPTNSRAFSFRHLMCINFI